MREPGPHHRITITAHDGLVRVRANGRIVAETQKALRLVEAGYPPVFYIPRADVSETMLPPSPKRSFCPYKGEARYFDLEGGIAEIAWSYESPFPAVARISGHLAFDPDRVEAIET